MFDLNIFSFFLVLSVFGHIDASPDCSDEARKQCGELDPNTWRGETWPEDAVELDIACRDVPSNLDCLIALAKLCPNSPQSAYLNYMTETKTLSSRLCSKTDEFRSGFLRNVPCLNKHVSRLYEDCKPPYTEIIPTHEEACKERDVIQKCVVAGVSQNCGTESRAVFDTLYRPVAAMNSIFCKPASL